MGSEKGTLPWLDGKPLLEWTVEALKVAGWQQVAVVRPEHFPAWNRRLPGSVIANPDPERGKTTSLAAGVRAVPASAAWLLVTAVDQPARPELYRRLRDETLVTGAKILAPSRGHPLVLAGEFREKLLTLDEASMGLRGLLRTHAPEIQRLPDTHDPCWDLNTPEDYREALAWFKTAPPRGR